MSLAICNDFSFVQVFPSLLPLYRSKEAKRVIFEGGRLQSGDEIGPKSINDATAVASPILEGASLSKKMKISNRSEDLMVRLRDAQRHKGKGLGLVDPWQRLAIELDARVRDCKVLEEVSSLQAR